MDAELQAAARRGDTFTRYRMHRAGLDVGFEVGDKVLVEEVDTAVAKSYSQKPWTGIILAYPPSNYSSLVRFIILSEELKIKKDKLYYIHYTDKVTLLAVKEGIQRSTRHVASI